MKLWSLAVALTLAVAPTVTQAGTIPCATPEQTGNIRAYFETMRPGVPLPVASRYFNVPESVIASALPTQAVASSRVSTPEIADTVWQSIEAWGAETVVTLVLAPAGKHAFAFPSKVPVDQDDASDGYLDVYADDGNGVHSHIQIAEVAAIFAHDMPNGDGKNRTRGVSFFGPNGDLIVAVYASIKGDPFDGKAVAGFAKTFDMLRDLGSACPAD